MSKLNSLKDLYLDELKDIYNAETQITKALPKMVEAATSPELKSGFEHHLGQTREHISRLETIMKSHGKSPKGKVCKAMQGLIAEGEEMMEQDANPAVMDAGLIGVAQRVEHYEMAAYGCVATYAEELGDTAAAKLLSQTLKEEKDTDLKLTKLAETRLNTKAMETAKALH